MKTGIRKWLRFLVIIISLGVILESCASNIERVYLVPEHYPPQPLDYPVGIYSEKPECPFREIVFITLSGGYSKRNRKIIEKEARKVGGDAVIISDAYAPEFTVDEALHPSSGGHLKFMGTFGTVIRWVKEECKK